MEQKQHMTVPQSFTEQLVVVTTLCVNHVTIPTVKGMYPKKTVRHFRPERKLTAIRVSRNIGSRHNSLIQSLQANRHKFSFPAEYDDSVFTDRTDEPVSAKSTVAILPIVTFWFYVTSSNTHKHARGRPNCRTIQSTARCACKAVTVKPSSRRRRTYVTLAKLHDRECYPRTADQKRAFSRGLYS